MKRICIVVSARVNSSRCYKKMIEPIGDTCLIEILINKLKKSKIPKEDIFIASPDEEIKDITNKHKLNFIKRSKESNEEENDIRVIFEWYKELMTKYGHVLYINACLPLLKIETINNFYTFCNNESYSRVFGIKQNKNYFFDENNIPINFNPSKGLNTKFIKGLKEAAHCLYFMKLQDIDHNNLLGGFKDNKNPFLYTIENSELFDIDYQFEFDIIKCYLESNKFKILI